MVNKSTMHIVKVLGVISWMLFFSGNSMTIKNSNKLPWLSLQEAEIAMKNEKKPILIDLYTNWCGWCKVMDKKTYSDKNVISYLAEKFYTVKLNAETKESILWSGKAFVYNTAYKTNEIALYFMQGRLSYPTTVIIPVDGSAPQSIPGYLTPKDIEILLKYFGENKYGRISFDEYRKEFKPAW